MSEEEDVSVVGGEGRKIISYPGWGQSRFCVAEGLGHDLLPVEDQLGRRAAKAGLHKPGGIGMAAWKCLKLGTLGRGEVHGGKCCAELAGKKAAGTYTWISSSSQVCSAKI